MLRWAVAVLLLGVVLSAIDVPFLVKELANLSPAVFAIALSMTVFQVFLSAWRWRYTLSKLGLSLPFGFAVREYYLAIFLNQVLPGGVLGDVNRAWRHSANSGQRLAALHGVAIERLSGQLVLALTVVFASVWLISTDRLLVASFNRVWLVLIVLVAAVGSLVFLSQSSKRLAEYLHQLRVDLRRSLFSWPALPVQFGSSLLLLASYLAVFLTLAFGAGYVDDMPALLLLTALCAFLLMSMVIPVTVAGWGVREGTAAVLWALAGLPSEQGVALSVAYGVLVFVSGFPGLVILLLGRRRLATGPRLKIQ
ncbi:hypothetical protein BKP64_04460 [Marinobacter salinus]|uniref:TIGR00374 family protein n=1 Tax=Marinobacter salinus TaxID=1874317 RepID=A0A1D9GIW5_9GAMM|nr:lysylphosphatidylglycerol synthase transmembrane domain-containing protein [Marinobacter salinus]AOY87491.1 hypothetical protein BKP64_04460 [Marinobacter salinus]